MELSQDTRVLCRLYFGLDTMNTSKWDVYVTRQNMWAFQMDLAQVCREYDKKEEEELQPISSLGTSTLSPDKT